jgi:hypothetical protein
MAGERKIIWIDKMPVEDQEKCGKCIAQVKSPRYCMIARLQAILGEEVSLEQIAERVRGIIIQNIPHNCPNGYQKSEVWEEEGLPSVASAKEDQTLTLPKTPS